MSAPMSVPADELNGHDEVERWRTAAETARVATARAEGELAGVRVALAAVEAERDRLAAELALARKGWLERVLEAVRRK
jgi:ABC-type branched-subunit amino acid transport system substrate-binding protein